MARRKYPARMSAKLYQKKIYTKSGDSSWPMAEADDGNHYKCFAGVPIEKMRQESVEGEIRANETGVLTFYPD